MVLWTHQNLVWAGKCLFPQRKFLRRHCKNGWCTPRSGHLKAQAHGFRSSDKVYHGIRTKEDPGKNYEHDWITRDRDCKERHLKWPHSSQNRRTSTQLFAHHTWPRALSPEFPQSEPKQGSMRLTQGSFFQDGQRMNPSSSSSPHENRKNICFESLKAWIKFQFQYCQGDLGHITQGLWFSFSPPEKYF